MKENNVFFRKQKKTREDKKNENWEISHNNKKNIQRTTFTEGCLDCDESETKACNQLIQEMLKFLWELGVLQFTNY